MAIYFYYNRSCATCDAVKEVTKKTIENEYSKKVAYVEYSLDEPEGIELAKKMSVYGQAVLVLSKDTAFNITNEAFLYALNNPEKYEGIIKNIINPLLEK